MAGKLALYAAVGDTLTQYDVSVEAATLTRSGSTQLPANIHYVVPHASRRYLYVASSDSSSGSGSFVGKTHHLSAFRIDPATGALTPHGAPCALPSRPIHITTDSKSAHVLVAFNRPSELLVFAVNADGTLRGEVKQNETVDAGIFSHQIRITADDKLAILVVRGNDAANGKAEDPGSLRVFNFRDGQLTNETAIAPNNGYGFGPRHLDFHPAQPWIYVALERQNALTVYRRRGDAIDPAATFTLGTLKEPHNPRPRQMVGTVRVHPNGRFVYVANRNDATVDFNGQPVFGGGENTLVCFSIDQSTGEPKIIDHADTHGIHCRNFAIDPSGRLLAASHIVGRKVRDGDSVREVPACISLFRIGDDGRLAFVRKYDIAVGDKNMFWMGLVDL
jgi:6-phosphogluconolactonase (cycloisomerase 2 family)